MEFDDSLIIAGPDFHVDLAALDARHPVHYSRRLLFFRCTSAAQRDAQVAALKVGVRALVARCPPLGGLVVPLPPEQARGDNEDWRTIVPDRGVEVILRDLSSQLPSFEQLEAENFAPTHLPYDRLVPVPSDIDNARPFAACKLQYSAIEGGAILTFAMTHSLADGSGTNELTDILSTAIRHADALTGRALAEDELRPDKETVGLDRRALRNMTSDLAFKIEDHPAFIWSTQLLASGQPLGKASHPAFAATTAEVPIVLHISPAKLSRLKADATTAGAPPISTHDALSALLWRSLLLIRSRRSGLSPASLESVVGHFYMPSDARHHVHLPASYVGNAVYQLTAALTLGVLLSPMGLPRAASAIRAAIAAVRPERVASYMAQIRDQWVGWQFLTDFLTTGAAMGTDWTSGVLYGQDWGHAFGPMVRFRYPGEAANCILPRLADGAAEVQVSVMPAEMEALTSAECFGRYLEP